MSLVSRRPRAALFTGAVCVALIAAGCGSDDNPSQPQGGGNTDNAACAAYEQYGKHEGTTVSVYSPIRDKEADLFEDTWAEFSDCTGIEITYEGSGEFEAQIQVLVEGGNAPDVAFFPQPGLLKRFADSGDLKPAADEVKAAAEEGWTKDWIQYGTVDGTFYGAPLGANVKSFVWYSPKLFAEKNYQVPETWDDLMALTDQIANDGVKPWCAGIESGDATGWPATDWIEDVILRELGPEDYDRWVSNELKFNDPDVVAAIDKVGAILKNEKYVNGGYGPVQSIASTAFQDGGLPIERGECAMHRQASFYSNFWSDGTKVAEDGDVFAFYLPGKDTSSKPVLGGGEFVAAFDERPEITAFQRYLASADFANGRMKLATYVSAHKGVDIANAQNAIDKLSMEILSDPQTVFRFDGSDLMPAAVGSGTFWRGMTDWINGKSTQETADFIQSSWPS